MATVEDIPLSSKRLEEMTAKVTFNSLGVIILLWMCDSAQNKNDKHFSAH